MTGDAGATLQPFTERSRRALLDAYALAVARMEETAQAYEDASDEEREPRDAAYTGALDVIRSLRDEYRARVPVMALSRCPLTGVLVRHSIDPYGIDGLWWDYEGPVRPQEHLPPSYFALTGALRHGDPVESTDFLVKPGPEAPFVMPRILARPEVVAVVSSLPVGRHQAFPIFYFADPAPEIERVNTWGTTAYWLPGPDGEIGWFEAIETVADFDFDLRPWIASGKLRWIAPGDAQVELRQDVAGCPYLDLPGRRGIVRIKHGQVWT